MKQCRITSVSFLILQARLASPAKDFNGGGGGGQRRTRRQSSHSFPVHHPIHARKRARNNDVAKSFTNVDDNGIYYMGGNGGNTRKRRLRGRPTALSSPSEEDDRQRREWMSQVSGVSRDDVNEMDAKPNGRNHRRLRYDNYHDNHRDDNDEEQRRLRTVSNHYLSTNPWYPSHDDLKCLDDGLMPSWMTWSGGYAEAHLFDDGNACCQRWFPMVDGCFDAVAAGSGRGVVVGGGPSGNKSDGGPSGDKGASYAGGGPSGNKSDGGPSGDKGGNYVSNVQQVDWNHGYDTTNWPQQGTTTTSWQQQQQQQNINWNQHGTTTWHNTGSDGGGKVGPSVEYTTTSGKVGPSVEYATTSYNNHGSYRPGTTGDKHGSVNSLSAADHRPGTWSNSNYVYANVNNNANPGTLANNNYVYANANNNANLNTNGNTNTAGNAQILGATNVVSSTQSQGATTTTSDYNGRGHGAPLNNNPSNSNHNHITEDTFPTYSCGAGWSNALSCEVLCNSGTPCPPGQSCHAGVPCPSSQVAASMGNAGGAVLGLIGANGEGGIGIGTNVCGVDYADAERRCRAGDPVGDPLADGTQQHSLGFSDDFVECPRGAGCPDEMHCYGDILCPLPPTVSPMPTRSPIPEYDINHSYEHGGHGKSIVAYYAAWRWYDRANLAQPLNLNYDMFTRINYAFFQTDAAGNIYGTDDFADPRILFGNVVGARPGMVCNQHVEINARADEGCRCHNVGAERKSCQFHRAGTGLIELAHWNGVGVYPSVGGWTLSNMFPRLAASRVARENFAKSCVGLILSYGFDGIDIDWEYPGFSHHGGTSADKANFVLLLRTVRSALDALGGQTGRYYGLTAALPCGPSNIANQDIAEVADVLDELNLMTYDFHGAWDPVTGHNAPLYDQPRDLEPGGSVHGCVENWVGETSGNPLKREHRSKVNIGLPFYGRSFLDTTELYTIHGGNDEYSWYDDDGTPQYFNIQAKLDKMTSVRDDETKTQYAYFNDGYSMVSYDDERSICDKVGYALDNDLGGFIIWEISGDMMDDFHQPLLEAVNRKLALPNINCKTSFGIPAAVKNDDPVDEATEMIGNSESITTDEERIVRGDKTDVVGLPIVAPPPAPLPAPIPVPSNASPYTLEKSQFGPLSVAADSCTDGGCPSKSKCVGNSAGGQLIKDKDCAPCASGQTWWPCDVEGLCWCWADGTDRIAPAPGSGIKLYKGGGYYYTICDDVLTRDMFYSIAPDARDPYSYEGLCDAILSYNAHHSEKAFGMGDKFQRTAELAAFLGNTLHESDEFRAGREYLMCADHKVVGGKVYCKPCDPGSFDWGTFTCGHSLVTGTSDFNEYCQPSSKPPEACECGRGQGEGGSLEGYVAASDLFFGRGAIQLSWNYNYYGASVALTGSADTFCDDPDLVSKEGRYAWGAGLYFWMEHTKEETTSHMEALKNGGDFGGTLNNINGGLECPAHGGWHVDAVKARLNRYCRAANALGLPNLMRLDNCAGLQESLDTCLPEGKCDECKRYKGKFTGRLVSNFVPAVAEPSAVVQVAGATQPMESLCDDGLMPWEENADCCVPNSAFIGDGACDPDAPYNTAACGYDGGDCCRDTCDTNSPFGCTTKEGYELGSYGPFGYFCVDPSQKWSTINAELCDVEEKHRIGDGRCNPAYNTAACNYDGGDCCEETCDEHFSFYECGSGVQSFQCLDPMFEEDTYPQTDDPTPIPTPQPTPEPTPEPTSEPTPIPTPRPTRRTSTRNPTRTPTNMPTWPLTEWPTESHVLYSVAGSLTGMCPKDMMECPDGKYLPRNPDNGCAFDPCPLPPPQEQTTAATVNCESVLKECPGGTYVAQDPDNRCRFFPCPIFVVVQEEEVPQQQSSGGSLSSSIASLIDEKEDHYIQQDEPNTPRPSKHPTPNPTRRPPTRRPTTPRPTTPRPTKLPKCKQDMLECPDTGKYVGRNPHDNCKFLECPSTPRPSKRPTPNPTRRPILAEKPKLPNCKRDMLECPGTGKYVGRNPHNNCKFLECPAVVEEPKKPKESLAASISSSLGQDAPPSPTANGRCADEVVRCPDGSFVGRDPDNRCRFFSCPSTRRPTPRPTDRMVTTAGSVYGKYNARVQCTKELQVCADGHYVGQDPDNDCEYYPCEDRSDATRTPTGRPTMRPTNYRLGSEESPVATKRPTKRPTERPTPRPSATRRPTVRPTPRCNSDMYACSDGNYVSRDPDNGCLFFPCSGGGDVGGGEGMTQMLEAISGKDVDSAGGGMYHHKKKNNSRSRVR